MYLSRVQLAESLGSNSQLGLLLTNSSYGMHRLLWDLFDAEEHGRFLFREEDLAEQLGGRSRRPVYYVLSQKPPCNESPLFITETKLFSPVLSEGDVLSFKLRANPTVARRMPGEKNSRRHDVAMDAQLRWLQAACESRQLEITGKKGALKRALMNHTDFQGASGKIRLEQSLTDVVDQACHQWLVSRSQKNGFSVEKLQVSGYRWNALPEKGRGAGFSSLDYEGILTVANPELFLKAITAGIGPAKGFGCGLILIRRL